MCACSDISVICVNLEEQAIIVRLLKIQKIKTKSLYEAISHMCE
jgi:hypothetical protein